MIMSKRVKVFQWSLIRRFCMSPVKCLLDSSWFRPLQHLRAYQRMSHWMILETVYVLGSCMEICRENPNLCKIGQKCLALYRET
jgi:hypothetical protein